MRRPWRLEVHDELGSTSDMCAERAAAGEPDGLAVLALRQTRARGSRGRGWQAPLGNLSLSVLLRDCGSPSDVGWMPLLAGVALVEALSPLVPDASALRLKWPNDVLLDMDVRGGVRGGVRGYAKLAGILIEATASAAHVDTLVVGFGVNLAIAPDIEGRATAALSDLATAPPPQEVAPALLDRLWHWRAAPRELVRETWLDRAQPIGQTLSVRTVDTHVEGIFAGLDARGHLILHTPDGALTISAGEVLLG